MAKKYIGIDIGSTASKVCVLEEGKEPVYEVLEQQDHSRDHQGGP